MQKASRRQPQATDFRLVQGGLNADGVGNLVSGLAATLPNTTYSSSVALVEVTGIAARRVGFVIGALFVAFAFLPKVAALLIAIPGPVVGVYTVVIIALLFVQGMRIVLKDRLDHRGAVVIGLSFWTGAAFQNGWVFPDLLADGFLAVLLGNGMTSGALAAIIMVLFIEATSPRARRLSVPLDDDALPKLADFLRACGRRYGWIEDRVESRLILVGEEMLATLSSPDLDAEAPPPATTRQLRVSVRPEGSAAEIEFVSASTADANVEDELTFLQELPDLPDVRQTSIRLLRGLASSVRHQQYHEIDVLTVRVANLR